ncbi:MAG: metal-sulfur cluster assembly factor [Candidatus ainarchaeum sp.]|nr:metal-sulfur cluster assembly factor [Candidatus ainarchaeum sp.]
MVTKEQLLEALGQVEDPELGVNIVDLGLIYGIDVKKKKGKELQKIFIRMTFTTPACPLMNHILDQVKEKLDVFKDADIEITVTFDPLWSPDRLSEKARIKLGMI